MKCLVTGAAGFIGSHLCEALLAKGHTLIGIDAFTDNYDPRLKCANLAGFASNPNFNLLEANLSAENWPAQVGEVDWVLHLLATRPGVRTSWGTDFSTYCDSNILATQRVLEACLALKPKKVIFASSSSVYGSARRLPVKESSPLRPVSPYGVTKLACEQLCRVYWTNYRVPVSMLRYFTVYGPRQRPDMAFSRWITAILHDQPIIIFGDGRQRRDFTFVSDAVSATMLAAEGALPGQVYNIAGGSNSTPREVIGLLAELTGRTPKINWEARQKGDARNTWANTELARQTFGFLPRLNLEEGLSAQLRASTSR